MLESVLIANRGEIARRIIRSAKALGMRAIAVYSDADADLPFVAEADEAVRIGPAAPAQSYRDITAILAAARATNAAAIHPGYGFLAENAEFAQAVIDADIVWVGPAPQVIATMGDKIAARNTMAAHDVPVAAGTTEPVTERVAAERAAAKIGYPLMVKAAAGGGGMGMAVVNSAAELGDAVDKISAFAERMFGDSAILLEQYFPKVRHVEVQILGLADGRVLALGERDCSVQRRNQKIAEETPSPGLSDDIRQQLLAAAVKAGEAIGYIGAGTVECLFVPASNEFVFLEMNTRLQVEHPITEAVFGVDLVAAGLRIAAGLDPDLGVLTARGHALELRVNAEDPQRFLPGPGTITAWREPGGPGIRVDSGYTSGNVVTPFYDSLLAKLVIFGESRADVLEKARKAVTEFEIAGPKNNLPFFTELLDDPEFVSGNYDTGIVGRMRS